MYFHWPGEQSYDQHSAREANLKYTGWYIPWSPRQHCEIVLFLGIYGCEERRKVEMENDTVKQIILYCYCFCLQARQVHFLWYLLICYIWRHFLSIEPKNKNRIMDYTPMRYLGFEDISAREANSLGYNIALLRSSLRATTVSFDWKPND